MEYLTAIIGGVLIGLGSVITLAASGKIPGISGVLARMLKLPRGDTAWRLIFLIGLIGGAGLMYLSSFGWQNYSLPSGRGLAIYIIAGLVVGFGTRVGGGCTSGHGVCGIGAGAKDGLIYTLVFMAAAIATVIVFNLIVGGAGA